jgi:hypothetical protein
VLSEECANLLLVLVPGRFDQPKICVGQREGGARQQREEERRP